jgi:hypothetical protein
MELDWIFSTDFRNYSNIKLNKAEAGLFHADGHDETNTRLNNDHLNLARPYLALHKLSILLPPRMCHNYQEMLGSGKKRDIKLSCTEPRTRCAEAVLQVLYTKHAVTGIRKNGGPQL